MIGLLMMLAAVDDGVPYKLILSQNQGGIAVVDYPSAARCAAARRSVDEQTAKRLAEGLARLPSGAQITSSPLIIAAICIPA